MTLWATQDDRNPAHIKVACTYGPITFNVTEDASHVRSFWSELGRVLDQVENKAADTKAG